MIEAYRLSLLKTNSDLCLYMLTFSLLTVKNVGSYPMKTGKTLLTMTLNTLSFDKLLGMSSSGSWRANVIYLV